jgi:putative membrane protein
MIFASATGLPLPSNQEINMNKQLILKRMAACATLAMMFGGAVAQNATGSAATGSMSGNSSATAGAGSSGTSGASGASSKAASGDQKMMRDIAYANISEVAAGKLALEKSQSADVKSFAQKMIDDHTKAQQELQTLADSKGVKLPTEPDAKHKALSKAMSAMKGEAFDKRYLKQGGLNDHENTHKLLARVQDKAKDADLKAYAAKTITAVDQHLTLAQETAGKHGMGNAKSNMTGAATDNGTMGSRTGGAMSSSGGNSGGAASSGPSGASGSSSGAMGGTGAGAMGNGGSPAGTGAMGTTTTPGASTGGTTGGAAR